MKGYVGTVFEIPESVAVADRCVQSGKKFGVDVTIIRAVFKDFAEEEAQKEKLQFGKWDTSFSNINAVVGNFLTQYRTWKIILESDEPGIVLEHDAIFVAPVPDLTNRGDIINIGKPSYGRFLTKPAPGVYPMFSKPGGYIPGAHGYYITPTGAKQLIDVANTRGIAPADIFLNKQNFPNIQELYPWVVEAHDSFSTIQKEKGCHAKHNYNNEFKVIS